ncbi:MAG TPA: hypothetical protein VF493_18055, partial [Terriglobales bacterium]
CSAKPLGTDFGCLPALVLTHSGHRTNDSKEHKKGAGHLKPKQMGGMPSRGADGFCRADPGPNIIVLPTFAGERFRDLDGFTNSLGR